MIVLILFSNSIYSQINTGIISSSMQTTSVSYLLDDYTGAGMAYSLRKLSSSSTNAIRIIRDSDSAEQDIGFSGQNLDQSAINSFCSGTTCRVHTWYDQSGNDYHLTQEDANLPIIYESSAIVTANGNPAVKFVGSDRMSNLGGINSSDVISSNESYCLVVGSHPTLDDFESVQVFLINNGGNTVFGTGHYKFFGDFLYQAVWDLFGVGENMVEHTASVSGFKIMEYQKVSSADLNLYIDNVDETDNEIAASYTPSISGLDIYFSDIDAAEDFFVQEAIIWPANQSSNRSNIYTNVSDYWN